jgi:hypothetical protein
MESRAPAVAGSLTTRGNPKESRAPVEALSSRPAARGSVATAMATPSRARVEDGPHPPQGSHGIRGSRQQPS